MKKIEHIGLIALSIFVFVLIGFTRDALFYNVNAQINFLEGYPHNYTHTFFLDFFEDKSVGQLLNLKWYLTILTMLIYFELSNIILDLFGKQNLKRFLVYIFAGLVILSACFYGLGYFTDQTIPGYRISRVFMGFLQSPLPIMILIPSQFIQKK